MFFITSKILRFLLDPVFWISITGLAIFFFPKKPPLLKKILVSILILATICSTELVGNFALYSLEAFGQDARRKELSGNYDYVVILSGYLDSDISKEISYPEFNSSMEIGRASCRDRV